VISGFRCEVDENLICVVVVVVVVVEDEGKEDDDYDIPVIYESNP
jgi:hypothetical protein